MSNSGANVPGEFEGLFEGHLGKDINISQGAPQIPSSEYGIFFLEDGGYPEMLAPGIEKGQGAFKKLLHGNFDITVGKKNQPYSIDTIYPTNSYGTNNERNEKNGILRTEEIATFVTIDPETGDVLYMTRSRPEMPGTNTPGQLDPGVISHGGLKQAGVINAWRYVADKLGKNDPELTEEEYAKYLQEHPFPEDSEVISTGSFIIANGSNARNAKKTEGEELEPRTSGLLSMRAIAVSYTDFEKIFEAQNEGGLLPTEYTVVGLDEDVAEEDWTPKHNAVHTLLQKHKGSIETSITSVTSAFQERLTRI